MSPSSPPPVPTRLRPVTITTPHADVELPTNARQKLVRRIRHLEGAASFVGKLDGASGTVELTASEKGFLVVAITAWMRDVGRNRVPGAVLRLQTALRRELEDPVDEAAEARSREAAAEPAAQMPAAAAAAAEPEPEPTPDPEAASRLLAVHGALEAELRALEALEDGSLGRARASLRRAVAELASALEREYGAQSP